MEGDELIIRDLKTYKSLMDSRFCALTTDHKLLAWKLVWS